MHEYEKYCVMFIMLASMRYNRLDLCTIVTLKLLIKVHMTTRQKLPLSQHKTSRF